MVSQVVSADWLKEQLDANNDAIRVFDVTWYSAKDAKEDYLKAHIPGAVYFDVFGGVEHTPLFPRNLPTPEGFQALARAAWVNDQSHVIVYDNSGQGGFFVGSRAWWTFKLFGHDKVSVLDGGMEQWTSKGYPTTTEVPQVQPGNFTSKYNASLKTTVDRMESGLRNKDLQVVDTRPAAAFHGDKQDPKSGHYPGAVSMHMAATFLGPDKKCLKTPEQLRQVFTEAGVDLSKPVAMMCNSGMSSCTALLVATMLGSKTASVYHGGFTEWKNTHPDKIQQS